MFLAFLKSHFSIGCCIVSFSFLYFLSFSHFLLTMVIVLNCACILLLFLFLLQNYVCCIVLFPIFALSHLKFHLGSHFLPFLSQILSCFPFPGLFLVTYLIVFQNESGPPLAEACSESLVLRSDGGAVECCEQGEKAYSPANR